MTIKILMIATEPSGDRLGSYLIDGLVEEFGSSQKFVFQGIGGPLMQSNGLVSLWSFEDLSVMGFVEVIPKLFKLLLTINNVANYAIAWQPDLVITIDSPDFSLRVSKKIKKLWPSAKTVHYVAPSVWAWRPKRAKVMAKFIDHVLALLPFEPKYMTAVGMSCDFVGHPVVSEKVPNNKEIRLFRNSLNIDRDSPIVSILPGSRKNEIKRMMPIYLRMMSSILKKYPNLIFVIPSNNNVSPLVSGYLKNIRLPIYQITENEDPLIFEKNKRILFSTSLAAVCTSGTVSLEVARMGAPIVVAYRASFVTEFIIKRYIKLKSATLINILTSKTDIPELLFSNCNHINLSILLSALLTNSTLVEKQRISANLAFDNLGLGGVDPKIRAARSVMKFLKN